MQNLTHCSLVFQLVLMLHVLCRVLHDFTQITFPHGASDNFPQGHPVVAREEGALQRGYCRGLHLPITDIPPCKCTTIASA